MEVSGQLHAPAALSPGKEPLVPIVQEAGWAPEPFWMQWWGEKFPTPAGTRPPIVQPVAQRYTTELSRLLHQYVCVCVSSTKPPNAFQWNLVRLPYTKIYQVN
jgi:hypothetical protein